jgi:hypothetical protein
MTGGAAGPVRRSRMLVSVAALSCLGVATLVACGGSSSNSSGSAGSASIPRVTITATAHGYDIQPPGPLPAGVIQFDLRNNDRAPHDFKFGTPLGTTTLDQLRATLSSGQLDQLPQKVELGLGWSLTPMQSQSLYITYQPGTNFVLSLISMGPNAPVQAAQGYLAQFTVSGTPPAGQPLPTVAGTLSIDAHSVSVPNGFGKGTFAMVNTDAMAGHALSIYRFTGAAHPLAEVVAAYAAQAQATGPTPPPGPPPDVLLGLQLLGGSRPFPPFGCSCTMGSKVFGLFALSPGTYVLLGDSIDPKTQVLEAAQGMAAEFTVS